MKYGNFMASGKIHFVSGILIGSGYMIYANQPLLGIIFSVLGALLPDIDSQISWINSIVEKLLIGFIAVAIAMSLYLQDSSQMENAFIAVLVLIAIQFLTHRGFMHGLLFAIVSTAAVGFYDLQFGIFYGLGIASHLILDVVMKNK